MVAGIVVCRAQPRDNGPCRALGGDSAESLPCPRECMLHGRAADG